MMRRQIRQLAQQPRSDDSGEDAGLLGVTSERQEEVRPPKLLVHVEGNPFLRVQVPKGRVNPATAVLVASGGTWCVLPADAHVDVAGHALLHLRLQKPHDVGGRCFEARILSKKPLSGVLCEASVAVVPPAGVIGEQIRKEPDVEVVLQGCASSNSTQCSFIGSWDLRVFVWAL